jgi:hypothetical protein
MTGHLRRDTRRGNRRSVVPVPARKNHKTHGNIEFMTEISDRYESRPEPNAAAAVGFLLETVKGYNDSVGLLDDPMRRILMDGAARQLIDQGVDEETAYASAQAIEGDDPHQVDRELIEMVHGSALKAAGLTLSVEADYARVDVVDGLKLAEVLAQPPVDELSRVRTVQQVDKFFEGMIHATERLGTSVHQHDIQAMLGGLPEGMVLFPLDYQLDPTERASIQQVVGTAPALAAALEKMGGSKLVADDLRKVASFVQEGNLVPWAISSYLGLLPETAIDRRLYDEQALAGLGHPREVGTTL